MTTLWTIVAIVVVLAPAVAIAVARNEGRRARQRAAEAVVSVDALGVRRSLVDGRTEAIDWAEVEVVEVVRASMGPHRASGGVVLLGGSPDGSSDRGALVPLDQVAPLGLLGYLGALTGFDARRFDQAAASRAPSRTVVWQRQSAN
jgi:hypothetical protein